MKNLTKITANGVDFKINNPIQITWNDDSNMNDYIESGDYDICGERTNHYDNLPIAEDGSGVSFAARLTVVVSALQSDNTEKCVTQFLQLSNRMAGEGNVYIRSQKNGSWRPWEKLQTNREVGTIIPGVMDNLIDSGIYSGVCADNGTMGAFVLITVNSSQEDIGITQLKHSIDTNGEMKTQSRKQINGIWDEWQDIGNIPLATYETYGLVRLGTHAGASGGSLYDFLPVFNDGVGHLSAPIKKEAGLGVTSSGLEVRIGTGIQFNESGELISYRGFGLGAYKNSIEYGQNVTWTDTSNLNDYTDPGIFRFYGERTNIGDNMPITNANSGHSFYAILTVIASTLQPANTEKCVTQFLQLSNRVGGEGNTYIRTYNENNNGLNGWSPWKKQQGMVETYINTDSTSITLKGVTLGTDADAGATGGLNSMTENGMYSGIYTNDLTLTSPRFVETFVLVVINDYAVSSQAGTPRRISQLKYATDTLTGQCTVKKRVFTGKDGQDDPVNNPVNWSQWEDVCTNELTIDELTGAINVKELIDSGRIQKDITYRAEINNSYWHLLANFFDKNGIVRHYVEGGNFETNSTILITYRIHGDNPTLWLDAYNGIGGHYIFSIQNIQQADEIVKFSSDQKVIDITSLAYERGVRALVTSGVLQRGITYRIICSHGFPSLSYPVDGTDVIVNDLEAFDEYSSQILVNVIGDPAGLQEEYYGTYTVEVFNATAGVNKYAVKGGEEYIAVDVLYRSEKLHGLSGY